MSPNIQSNSDWNRSRVWYRSIISSNGHMTMKKRVKAYLSTGSSSSRLPENGVARRSIPPALMKTSLQPQGQHESDSGETHVQRKRHWTPEMMHNAMVIWTVQLPPGWHLHKRVTTSTKRVPVANRLSSQGRIYLWWTSWERFLHQS